MTQTDSLSEKISRIVARIFSTVFSPLLVPTYGVAAAIWLSILALVPSSAKWSVVLVTWLLTCLLPMLSIAGLVRLGKVSDPGLNNRSERTVPYIITALSYLACAFYLFKAHAPVWLWGFPCGGAIAVAICLPINFKWKISAHMAGMGGLIAVFFVLVVKGVFIYKPGWWITAAVLAAGCVGSSRVFLGRHTVMQVIAGTAVGFICVFLVSMI